jgi:hypothetical protein
MACHERDAITPPDPLTAQIPAAPDVGAVVRADYGDHNLTKIVLIAGSGLLSCATVPRVQT